MFTKNTLLMSAMIAASFALAGCNDSSSSSTQSGQGDISLNLEEAWDAEKNVTYDVVATNDGDPGKIKWLVSDDSILEITSIERGGAGARVKAKDYGTATITASIHNGNSVQSEVTVEGLSQNVFAVKASADSQTEQSSGEQGVANFAFSMPHNSGVLNAKIDFEVDGASVNTDNATVSGKGLFEVYEADGQPITWTGTSEEGNPQGYVILYAQSETPDELFYGVPAQDNLTLGEISFNVSNTEEVALKVNKVQMAGVNELLNVHQYEPSIAIDTASVLVK